MEIITIIECIYVIIKTSRSEHMKMLNDRDIGTGHEYYNNNNRPVYRLIQNKRQLNCHLHCNFHRYFFWFHRTYLIRKFPFRWTCAFRDDDDLTPVPLFNCDNWLALVRGNRGDGLPVPGRTGGVQITTRCNVQNQISTNKPMAIKAFIFI